MTLEQVNLQVALEWAEQQEKKFMVVRCQHADWTDVYDMQGEHFGALDFRAKTLQDAVSELGYMASDGFDLSEWEMEHSRGYRARLTAPGYLDCTSWTATHDIENGAIVELWEMYGDE